MYVLESTVLNCLKLMMRAELHNKSLWNHSRPMQESVNTKEKLVKAEENLLL